jgi:SAM-dependent methyltransferase
MREYWSGLAASHGVPAATGLQKGVEYTEDIEKVCATMGFTFEGRVLDIGCGTGRIAALAPNYHGVDVCPEMVEYARSKGRRANLIEGPESLPGRARFNRVCILSVFTHVSREVRQAYLEAAHRLLRPEGELLVDIFIGPEGGGFPFWKADRAAFLSDAAKFEVLGETTLNFDGSGDHTYFRMRPRP